MLSLRGSGDELGDVTHDSDISGDIPRDSDGFVSFTPCFSFGFAFAFPFPFFAACDDIAANKCWKDPIGGAIGILSRGDRVLRGSPRPPSNMGPSHLSIPGSIPLPAPMLRMGCDRGFGSGPNLPRWLSCCLRSRSKYGPGSVGPG